VLKLHGVFCCRCIFQKQKRQHGLIRYTLFAFGYCIFGIAIFGTGKIVHMIVIYAF